MTIISALRQQKVEISTSQPLW